MRLLKLITLAVLAVSFFIFADAQGDIDYYLEEYIDGYSNAYFTAQYNKAIGIANEALKVLENKFGADHANVAALLANLGTLYKVGGKYAEAEKYYKRALEIYEKSLGLDNPYSARVWLALGENYQSWRRYFEAETCYNNAKIILEKNYGSANPYTVAVSVNLGALYAAQHKYNEAEALLKQAIGSISSAYGQGHPVLIKPLGILGSLYDSQGKAQEAEQFYKYAWFIFKENFSKDEATIEKALSRFKQEVAKLWAQKTEPIYKRMTDLSEIYIGPWHPQAPEILDNLPGLYLKEKRFVEGENIYGDALEIMLSNLGAEHLNIAKVSDNMARFYRKMGKADKAAEAQIRAKNIRAKAELNK